MASTKLVVRLLDEHDNLLGWAECEGQMRGDGKLWVKDPTPIMIESAGTVAYHSVHWCDANVEIRSRVDHAAVTPGQMIQVPGDWVPVVIGKAASGLPPVTVRTNIQIALPAGKTTLTPN